MNTNREPHVLVQLGVALFVVMVIYLLTVGFVATGLLIADATFMALLFAFFCVVVRSRIDAHYAEQEKQQREVFVQVRVPRQ